MLYNITCHSDLKLRDTLISIIIINYNGAKYLPALLSSLKNQSYKDFEVIIWDNNSIDQSITIIESISDLRLTLIKSDENIGFAAANNKALKYCNGDYIMLLNNDTLLYSSCLELLVQKLVNNDIVAPLVLFYYHHLTFEVGSQFNSNLLYESLLSKACKHIICNGCFWSEGTEIIEGDTISLPITAKKFNEKFVANKVINIGKRQYRQILETLNGKNLRITDNINSSGLEIDYLNGKAADRDICRVLDLSISFDTPKGFSGCCFMTKRAYIDQYGLYDDQLFMYYEDVDFFWRLSHKSELRLKLVEQAIIRHDYRFTHNPLKKYYIDRNRLIVLRKNARITSILRAYLLYILHVIKLHLTRASSAKSASKALFDAIIHR